MREGRSPDSIKVLNTATIIVAPTAAEALDLKGEYQEYSSEEGNLAMLSGFVGVDLSKYDLDHPLEYVESNAIRSIMDEMTRHNRGRKIRIRDLAAFGGLSEHDRSFIVGSPEQVCDEMITWVEEAGVDGFNLIRTVEPAGLISIISLVIPELQRRGYFKTNYNRGTFREKMFPECGPRLSTSHFGASFRRGA